MASGLSGADRRQLRTSKDGPGSWQASFSATTPFLPSHWVLLQREHVALRILEPSDLGSARRLPDAALVRFQERTPLESAAALGESRSSEHQAARGFVPRTQIQPWLRSSKTSTREKPAVTNQARCSSTLK